MQLSVTNIKPTFWSASWMHVCENPSMFYLWPGFLQKSFMSEGFCDQNRLGSNRLQKL